MCNRKYSYHVICDCFYVTNSGMHLPISRIGDIEVSFNGIIDSEVSMKDTCTVLEYRICRSRELRSSIPSFMRDCLLFSLSLRPLGRKSSRSPYSTFFGYRFISD